MAPVTGVAAGVLVLVVNWYVPPGHRPTAIVMAAQTNPEFRQVGARSAATAPLDVSVYRAGADGVTRERG